MELIGGTQRRLFLGQQVDGGIGCRSFIPSAGLPLETGQRRRLRGNSFSTHAGQREARSARHIAGMRLVPARLYHHNYHVPHGRRRGAEKHVDPGDPLEFSFLDDQLAARNGRFCSAPLHTLKCYSALDE